MCRRAVLLMISSLSLLAQPSPPLRVGFGNGPPIITVDSSGKPGGFSFEVLNEAARRQGVQLEWIPVLGGRDLEDKLSRGAIDLTPAALLTPERSKQFWVSSPWWFHEFNLVTLAETRVASDLAQQQLAMSSSRYHFLAERFYPKATLLSFDSIAQATQAVCRGDAVAALMTHAETHDILTNKDACRDQPLRILPTDLDLELAIIARKDRAAIASRLRERIDQLALDGVLTSIAARYPPLPRYAALRLTEALRASYERRVWIFAAVVAFAALAASGVLIFMQRRTQRILRREHELLLSAQSEIQTILDAVPAATFIVHNGDPVRGSRMSYDLLKLRPDADLSLQNTPLQIAHDGSAITAAELPVNIAVRTGQPIRDYELEVGFPGGGTLHLFGNAVPLVDRQGKTRGAVAAFVDITPLKIAEERLRQSNEDLEQFASAVSHDLQEPLRMVNGYTKLLARRYTGKLDQEADDFIKFANDGAVRLQAMLQGLLDYARAASGDEPATVVDANVVLNTALSNLELTLRESGAEITHDPLPKVRIPELHLLQLLQNLIGNAVKYRGEAPPRVHVSATRQDAFECFTVVDNGIGFEPKFADKAFTIFKQLHQPGRYSGSGVGLAICKRIVERYRGRIWAESEPGRGSKFHFTVPAA